MLVLVTINIDENIVIGSLCYQCVLYSERSQEIGAILIFQKKSSEINDK